MAVNLKFRRGDIIKSTPHLSWAWDKVDLGIPELTEGYYGIRTLKGLVSDDRPKVLYRSHAVPTQIALNIGERWFYLNSKLRHLYDVILDSRKILDLKEDWDQDGAIAVNKEIYFRAIETLIAYSNNVLNVHNIAINAPHISVAADGSIDLDWKTPTSELLLTILNTEDFSLHYYGDDGNNNTVIKGTLNESRINEDLSYWMRKL